HDERAILRGHLEAVDHHQRANGNGHARTPQLQHLADVRVGERQTAGDLVVGLVERAASDEDADHERLAVAPWAAGRPGRIALKTSPPTTAATAPITLC